MPPSMSSSGVVIMKLLITPPLKYFRQVVKSVNERENDHETQTNKLGTGLVIYQY